MDSIDLLAREDEFKKLNKQLEKKTESLIKEIEHAMQKQDIFADFSSGLTLSPVHSTKKHNCHTQRPTTPPQTKPIKKNPQCVKNLHKPQNNIPQCAKDLHNTKSNVPQNVTNENGTQTVEIMEHCGKDISFCACYNVRFSENTEFLYAFVSVNVKEKVLPPSFTKDRPSVENVCKFLSSKVKLMQEQIDKLQSTLDKKGKQCEGHLTQLAELETERMSLLNKANNMKASSADAKTKCAGLQAKLNEKEKQYKEQRSEVDRLTVELKRARSRSVAAEAKAASQLDTIDNLKQQLETAKRVEKEFRESSRNLYNSHQSAISRLEAQIKTLTTRIDRQMALIDNLRRQNVLLSTEGAVRGLERDYSDLLNQDF